MSTIYLVRHGRAEGAEGRVVGHRDLPLSDAGAEEMRALAATWSEPPPVHLFSSDLRRAVASARILADRLGVEPCVDPRLRELSFGSWEGRLWDDIHRESEALMAAWAERWWQRAPPGGETFAELRARVAGWLDRLPADGVVVAVAHAGTLRAVLAEAAGVPIDRLFGQPLGHARVTALHLAPGRSRLLFVDRGRFPAQTGSNPTGSNRAGSNQTGSNR